MKNSQPQRAVYYPGRHEMRGSSFDGKRQCQWPGTWLFSDQSYDIARFFNGYQKRINMPFIQQIEPENATGRLKRIYDAALKRAGYIAGIIKVMSQDPGSCEGSMGFYGSLMQADNDLPAAQREMLATVVSNVNDCFY